MTDAQKQLTRGSVTMIRGLFVDAIALTGLALILFGIWLTHPPAAVVVLGVMMAGGAYLYERKRKAT